MTSKLTSRRRVSTRTTAPSAPSNRPFHRNQKRSWPGVPNRYSTSWSVMLMRTKSIATVVAVFVSEPYLSSTPTPACVMVSSVVSGLISLTEPTMVVLPTPKPPTITIFTAAWAVCGRWSSVRGPVMVSELLKSMHHRFEEGTVGQRLADDRGARRHQFGRQQLGEQDGHHAERQAEIGGQLGHGQGGRAEPEQRRLLRRGGGRRVGVRHD